MREIRTSGGTRAAEFAPPLLYREPSGKRMLLNKKATLIFRTTLSFYGSSWILVGKSRLAEGHLSS